MKAERIQSDKMYLLLQREFQKYWFREYRGFLEEAYDYCANTKKLRRFLDMGCYTGAFHLLYGKYFSQVELADVADLRASFITGKFLFHEFSLDSRVLPHGLEGVDFINCLEVIEHVPDEGRAMANLFALLRPGGYLLMNVPNRLRLYELIKSRLGFPTRFPTRSADDYANVHYREYSQDEIVGLVQRSGFKIERTKRVIFGVGPLYLKSAPPGLDKYKKNIVILAYKPN